jgi:RimJ/RimL family protein N-acetyltransferase
MAQTVTLKTGEEMVIRTVEPPLGAYADQVGCWRDVREDLLGGALTEWLYTPYFVGEIGGEVVGSLSYYVATDRRDVGVIEFVATDERHRNKGIGSHLMQAAIDRFLEDDGKALYLCTTNPIAGHLYERHEFRYHLGDGMRYLAPGAEDFDDTRWVHCGEASVRDAHWGDLPSLSALYNHPEPKWLLKDPLTESFAETRYESHFVKLMRRIENGRGGFLVLENLTGAIVGASVFERIGTFYEQHVATMSFRVTPPYEMQAVGLLAGTIDRARALNIRTLQISVAACDTGMAELLVSAGYAEEARLKDRLRVDGGWMDVLVYSLTIEGEVPPYRAIDDYYGTRKAWQQERDRETAS